MRADNTHHLIAAAARTRAEEALAALHTEGRPISVSRLARTAGVSRSWLYEQPDILDRLQQQRPATRPSEAHVTRASDASLRRRLEIAHQRIQDLTEQNDQLRRRLERAHAARRSALQGQPDVVALLPDRRQPGGDATH